MALLVNDVTPRVQYVATAAQTVFVYPFAIFADADLKVYQTLSGVTADDTADLLTLTTHYTVSDAGVTAGGNVTLVTGAAVGDIITIVRDLAVERTTDYQNLGDLASTSFNDDLDKLVMMVQQQEDKFTSRLLTFQESTNIIGVDTTLPTPVASEFMRWNATKTALEGILLADVSTDLSAISSYMLTLIDDTTAAEARNTLGFTKGADISSATALTVGTDGNYFDVTGTTTITSISTVWVGAVVKLHFDGILTLTHHATDLVLPGEANITTAAGDEAEFIEYASGDWRCINYQPFVSVDSSVQIAYTLDGDLATGTGTIPLDTSIPQNTEGDQYMSVSITPKQTTNLLKIDVVINLGSNAADTILIAALFQDSIANALAAGTISHSQTDVAFGTLSFTYVMVAGTTSAITYKVRAGASAAATTAFNGASGVVKFGGAGYSSITVTEYLP